MISEAVFRMLERFLLQTGEVNKLSKLETLKIEKLHDTLPPSIGHAVGINASTYIH